MITLIDHIAAEFRNAAYEYDLETLIDISNDIKFDVNYDDGNWPFIFSAIESENIVWIDVIINNPKFNFCIKNYAGETPHKFAESLGLQSVADEILSAHENRSSHRSKKKLTFSMLSVGS